ncbi:hypothetical protein EV191_101278 [Tamaricihabitans halophyticus]|uniref:Uncharacterized protein n=1 Tax=Tamaricihabitans halophyticus TaxID=1262583 RepID=A0A4R2R2V1_9PSEU|nr:hypothetical protein [Tamaricihabitans halophyticus]TCP56337.1 hypothetical protein EV191_101278 [Tamaricihabitans halophyticus]
MTARAEELVTIATEPAWCPLPSVLNPARDEAQRRAQDWVDQCGLGDDAAERARLLAAHR